MPAAGVLNAAPVPPEGESRTGGVLELGPKAEAPTERELAATGDGEAASEPQATGAAAGTAGEGAGAGAVSACRGPLGGAPVDAEQDAAACAVEAGRGEATACAGDPGGTPDDAGGAAAGAAACPVEGRLRLILLASLNPLTTPLAE